MNNHGTEHYKNVGCVLTLPLLYLETPADGVVGRYIDRSCLYVPSFRLYGEPAFSHSLCSSIVAIKLISKNYIYIK